MNVKEESMMITAQVYVVGKLSKKKLTQVENFTFTTGPLQNIDQFSLQIEADVRFTEEFRKRLKNNMELKHRIGSTRWEVRVHNASVH